MSGNGSKVIIGSAVLLVVVCLVLAIYTVLRVVSPFINTSGKINAEIAKIREKGEPVTLSQLEPPPVPDNENAAIIYEKAFQLIKTPQGKKDFEIIGEFISLENGKRDAKLWAQAKDAVNRNKEIISLIKEAQKRPKCRFPVDWSKGWCAEYPHLAKLRDLARYLSADILIKAKNGNMDDVVNSLLLQIRLSESVKDEHCLIPLFVRIAIDKIMSRSVYESLSYGNLNEAQAEKLYIAISKFEYNSALIKALYGERVFGISMFQYVSQNGPGVPGGKGSYPASGKRIQPKKMKIFESDEIYYLKYMAKQIENGDLSYREVKIKGINVGADPNIPKYAIFSRTLIPIFSGVHRTRDEAIADLAGIQTLLACQAYRDRYNAYPQTLNELKNKISWKLPEDVFSGKDMVYKRQNNGFILYSVGPDLKDDGGHPPKKPGNYKDGDDIVWKLDK